MYSTTQTVDKSTDGVKTQIPVFFNHRLFKLLGEALIGKKSTSPPTQMITYFFYWRAYKYLSFKIQNTILIMKESEVYGELGNMGKNRVVFH